MTTKTFHIGDVLTITSGVLVSPRHVDGIYDICSHMTGEDVFTHQLPRVAEEIEGDLRRQHPELCATQVPEGMDSEEAVMKFLAGLYEEFGEYVEVRSINDPADHTSIDPIAEMRMRNSNATIIGIRTSDDE